MLSADTMTTALARLYIFL